MLPAGALTDIKVLVDGSFAFLKSFYPSQREGEREERKEGRMGGKKNEMERTPYGGISVGREKGGMGGYRK